MHCIASAEADLIKFQYIVYKIPSSSDSKPLLALPYYPNQNLKFCSSKGHITDWQVDNSKAASLSPALQLRAVHTHINKGKNNLKLQLTRKTNKFKKKLKITNLLLELKSTHTPGLISAPAMRGTETHKRISESTINTIKNPAMLRARLHLLSHKESLVLSGKQKKINFLIFIDRCGHRAKAALGAYVGLVWSQSVTGSSSFSALLQGESATAHPQSPIPATELSVL